MHKAWCSIEEVPYYFFRSSIKFQGHAGWKSRWFGSNLSKITRPVAAIKSLRFALLVLVSIWDYYRRSLYSKFRVPTGCGKPGKIKFSGKVMESHGTLKKYQKSWKSRGTFFWEFCWNPEVSLSSYQIIVIFFYWNWDISNPEEINWDNHAL